MILEEYSGIIMVKKEDVEKRSIIDILERSLEKYKFDHSDNPFCIKSRVDVTKEGKKIYEDLITDKDCFYSLYADIFNEKFLCKQKQEMLHLCKIKYPNDTNLKSVEKNCGDNIHDIKEILRLDREEDKDEYYINIFKSFNSEYVYDEDSFAYIGYNEDEDGNKFGIEAYPSVSLLLNGGEKSYISNIDNIDFAAILDRNRKKYRNMYELAKMTAQNDSRQNTKGDNWIKNKLVRDIFELKEDDTLETFVERKTEEAAPINSQILIIDGEWYECGCSMTLEDVSIDKIEYRDIMEKYLNKYEDTHMIISVNIVKEIKNES